MEALLEDLSCVSVTPTENNIVQPHPKYSEFKRRSKEESQELRRRELLKEQKRRRSLNFDANRDLKKAFAWTRKPPRSILKDKYRLMYSEWLVDIPDDLATKWKMLLCPGGKHVLVIAIHGKTKIMNRMRQEVGCFDSVLPGGSPACPQELTVLDCIWIRSKKTLYVLDMLCWAHHDVVECEAEFRFFWLQCKFEENPNMTDKKSNQGYNFVHLERHLCEPVLIESTMSNFPPFPDDIGLDGVLFYHMEASYMMEKTTPLVGWLKGYMIPDLLQVPVAPQYMKSRPPGLTLREHIGAEENFIKQRRHKNWKKKTRNNKMECETIDAKTDTSEGLVGQPAESMVVQSAEAAVE